MSGLRRVVLPRERMSHDDWPEKEAAIWERVNERGLDAEEIYESILASDRELAIAGIRSLLRDREMLGVLTEKLARMQARELGLELPDGASAEEMWRILKAHDDET